jgi:hypothetical protein
VQETGGAVVNGAISTLIAALCLSGSGSYVFLTFFYALVVVVLAGAAACYGLLRGAGRNDVRVVGNCSGVHAPFMV